MRLRRLLPLCAPPLALAVLLAAMAGAVTPPAAPPRAGAGEAGPRRSELWRHSLAGAEGLAPAVEGLAAALVAGNARAIVAQSGPGRLRLQSRGLGLPPTLCGPAQARVLLHSQLQPAGRAELRIGPAALDGTGERARVAFDLLGGELGSGSPAQRRFIAVYRRVAPAAWRLEALRCP